MLLDKLESSKRSLENSNCLLSDFGLSRVGRNRDGTLAKVNQLGGTRVYMGPEILMLAEYAGDYDPFRADIWALGVLLYYLVNREYPFRETAAMLETQLSFKVKFGSHFNPNSTPSPELENILSRMLDPTPETRISMSELMQHRWFSAEVAKVEESVPKQKVAIAPTSSPTAEPSLSTSSHSPQQKPKADGPTSAKEEDSSSTGKDQSPSRNQKM